MKRTGRTWAEYLEDYLARVGPDERAIFDEASAYFAEENERLNQRKEPTNEPGS